MAIGGAVDAISNLARGAMDKLGSSGVKKMAGETFIAQEEEFKLSPEAMKAGARLKDYDFKRQQILNELYKPANAVHEVIKNDPAQLQSTLGKIHSDLKNQNHPAATHAAQIIGLDPKNADMTLPEYSSKIIAQARLLSHDQNIGKNNALLIGDIMPLYESGDPVAEAHANALLNIASNQFHDATRVKIDMKKALRLENKYRVVNGMKPLHVDLKKFDTSNVYERTNAIERFASQRARWYLAPMIAVNHMSTFMNPLLSTPLESISKAMGGMGNGEIKELMDASAVFASQNFHMLSEDILNETGRIATKIAMPEAGRLYGQIFHNPGFNFIRKAQLKASALMGYHATNYWAFKAVEGDKSAILELKELGLDPEEIIKRKGELTREEKIKGMYHFTNNRIFISRPFDRSLNATRNPWTRMLTMFHGYVSSQQRFMRRELQKKFETGDYIGIARFAGTVGLMFPMMAPMLKAAETFARTASPDRALQGMQSDYKHLTHPQSVAQYGAEYLDMLSYFGSWGIMHGFITASHGDRLALALMGPIAGDVVRTTQDAVNLTTKSTKTGKHNIKPLAKDLLQQSIPVAGNIIANQMFPAKTIND